MEERQVDVISFNPKSADSFDHYVYTCYLEKEGGCPTADLCIGKRGKTENDLYQKHDWLQVYRGRMQQQFDVGYYEGHMRFKKMYERLMEQFLRVQHD